MRLAARTRMWGMAEQTAATASIDEPSEGIWSWIIWFVAALFFLYEYNLRNMTSVMQLPLQRDFNATAADLGNAVGAYDYIYAPMQIVVGLLLDRFGAKRLLILACAVCATGTFFFSQASDLTTIALARLLMGFGSSFAYVSTLYLATIWFPQRRIALVTGFTCSLGVLGEVFENPLSLAVSTYGWRTATFVLAWIGVAICFFLVTIIPSEAKSPFRLTNNDELHLSFRKRLWSVAKSRQVWLISFVVLTLYLPLSVFGELWGPPFLTELFGTDNSKATLLTSVIFISWAISGTTIGWLSDRIGSRKMPQIFGSLLLTLSLGVLIFVPDLPDWLLVLCLVGMGIGSSSQVASYAAVIEIAPRFARGTAAAVVNFVSMIFEGTYQFVIGSVLDWSNPAQSASANAVYSLSDYRLAFAWVPILAGLGFFASLWVRDVARRSAAS